MARNGTKGAPEGRGGSGIHSGFNPRVESEQYVLIVADNSDFAEFVSTMWSDMATRVEARGGSFNVSEEQFKKYCVTAIKVRVQHCTRVDWRKLGHESTDMSVDEGWALPVPMHDVLSSIGRVRLGSGDVTVRPVWDKSSDHLVLTRAERDVVTRELRAACSAVDIRVFAEMSKDVEGHHQTMVLVYLPQSEEWMGRTPFEVQDAAKSMFVGAKPVTEVRRGSNGADYEVVDTEQVATVLAQIPHWVPELRMERNVVVRYITEMASLAS